MHRPGPDPLLDDLDDAQRAAVTSTAAPLAVLAGAGSGKTRVLTRRIAWQARHGRLDPAHVLALTFTRKAAGELLDRLAALGVRHQVTAGTFHAMALAQLRRRCADRGAAVPAVLERKSRLLAPMTGVRGAEAALAAAELAGEIEWAKARLVRPESYEEAVAGAGRRTPRPPAEVATVYERYEREKRRRRVVDFDDLLWWCGEALEHDADFAAAQRWRFRHLFVDEFQDVSPAQLRLLRAWLGGRPDLCVVGDPDQAIYGFAGADAGFLTGFARRFPGAEVVRLRTNYRSSPEIVAVATAVLPVRASGRRPPRSALSPGPRPLLAGHATGEDEAKAVARGLVEAAGTGRRWSSMAVLYRTNAQSALFEEALRAAGVPARVRGASRFLDRPEVKVALDALRRTERAAPGRAFTDHLADLAELAADTGSPGEERREHADELARLGREYLEAEGGSGSLDGFLSFLQVTLRGDSGPADGDAVELLTFHRAKGLEFDTVFVTGLERGLVPIAHATTPAERAEERRLLHVALTRAERVLHLSWARRRTVGLRETSRTRSPLLDDLPLDARPGPAEEVPPPAVARARLARARELVAAARPPDAADPALLDALVSWRRDVARASGVPAYVVFHDATLEGVAATKPRSREALLGLSGIGPVKVERYGDALLELVARHR